MEGYEIPDDSEEKNRVWIGYCQKLSGRVSGTRQALIRVKDRGTYMHHPTPRNALFVGPLVRPFFYPHLTHTHTNLMCERAR